jgi:hypothetical protein
MRRIALLIKLRRRRRRRRRKKIIEKNKKIGYLAVINKVEEAIQLLFQNIDYEELNKIKIQLIAELKTIIFNINQITTRSNRLKRAAGLLIRFRNS